MSVKPKQQRTIGARVELAGVGVHGGEPCRLVMHPAGAGEGVVFRRVDRGDALIPAILENVVAAEYGVTVANADGVSVATVEHLLAALALAGVDNVLIEVDGPETPIMDGSAAAFVRAIADAGVVEQNAPRRQAIVTGAIDIDGGDGRSVIIEPYDGRRIDIEIDFGSCLIGRQTVSLDLDDPQDLVRIATARTFCRAEDIEPLRAAGFIKGGGYENSLVVEGDRLANDEVLRDPYEFALHKALDLVGDFYLLGAPFIGRVRAVKPGHNLNIKAATALGRIVFSAPRAGDREALAASA